MKQNMIAPCGMNCSLCFSYQITKYELNKKGFKRKTCDGCLPRSKNCLHMGDRCQLLKNGKVRFCFECPEYPCKRLKNLDKRYRLKYHMSMIENLESISKLGVKAFIKSETPKWSCPKCGEMICCHNGLCLSCDWEILKIDRKYRWNEELTSENKTKKLDNE
ncbi:MAG: hypothetical protein PWP16_808 [Eubacteriaceae bacterium]|nr:hypothetical protein [Eubacteriaceae bacterium]MDK2904472.1 hypothetical protein [Eubacteriaceae bacterium]MDK2935167.1 hypothetical protein [Eubacteriaceae bacterium]MDK2961277.1 hypothetical protein [Eubacteriaceae bacterium]MDN5307445.1 hypothetical protein [Eubacteriaceae bacterium]